MYEENGMNPGMNGTDPVMNGADNTEHIAAEQYSAGTATESGMNTAAERGCAGTAAEQSYYGTPAGNSYDGASAEQGYTGSAADSSYGTTTGGSYSAGVTAASGYAYTGANSENSYGTGTTYGSASTYNGTYQQRYPVYEETPSEKKKEKKPMGAFGKICVGAAIGLFFGIFAGVGFLVMIQGGRSFGFLGTTSSSERETERRYAEERPQIQSTEKTDSTVNTASTVATTVVTDVTGVVDEVMPAVVSITNSSYVQYYYYTVPSESSGSGIIIGSNDDELLIVTNYHVVADTEGLSVCFADGSEAKALVKGTDRDRDLAVIAVQLDDISDATLKGIKIAKMGDSDTLKVGEPAIAIGNALGIGQSVTTGVISALNREVTVDNITGTFIQTDAAINHGNSGGALLNINGEVIGINSSKIGGSDVEGMGYAIPISAAKPIIEELMQKTTRTLVPEDERGYLGITGATVTQQEMMLYGYPEGVYVANVNSGSAADEAGLQRGDYITSFDGESLSGMEALQRLLMYYREGDEIEITVLRPVGNNYKEIKLQVTLGDRSVLGRTN
ncbi:MAG: trypsin-like peptidase domain-containing protein [Lachnospiraceae bacterium]|nr:trypsin-like peptidase domain-containing protein [Lachnospiraceae bacterium]